MPPSRRPVAETRQTIEAHGPTLLRLDDLRLDDLATIDWLPLLHLDHVASALARVAEGDVEYLTIRAPTGVPVAMGGLDFAARRGAGTIWQLVTHPDLRGLGLGSRLIGAAESRIERRGRHHVVLGVEDDNPRARALYRRLGYAPVGREVASWLREGPDGEPRRYETEITILRKTLAAGELDRQQ